mmetsp:Transcript_28990/g.5243  ORF Transcript_28990/g.5243 Transcript_28990/m.5243 type:complete len:85 (-) Transcript_28990:108-362(-)
MKGDYYRYAAEVGDTTAVENGSTSYQRAQEAAESLAPANPNKLGLALNYSVFHYEVLKDQQSACQLAQSTFDSALSTLDNLDEV